MAVIARAFGAPVTEAAGNAVRSRAPPRMPAAGAEGRTKGSGEQLATPPHGATKQAP